MATTQDQRPRYYEDQYLGAEDLDQGVVYSHVQQARHALGAHTWGISIGLDLVEKPRPGGGNRVDVFVTPGYAWDGYGHPILVLAPAPVPESLFVDVKFDPQNPDDRDGKGRLTPVWLQYDLQGLRSPLPGFETCREGDHYSRIQETFRIVVGEFARSDQHSSVVISGTQIDPREALSRFDAFATPLGSSSAPVRTLWDESVPHQEYPSDDPPLRWLVPIGAVRWLPAQNGSGQFVKRDESGPTPQNQLKQPDSDVIRARRHYAGVVVEAIEGAGGVIRLRNRFKDPASASFQAPRITTDPAKPPENEVVWVEGDLRVVGDARLAGGKLAFRTAGGGDEGTPLEVRRSVAPPGGPGNKTLQVVIGPDIQDTNRFAVGRIRADQSVDQKFVVTGSGNVGIDTSTPGGRLSIEGSVPEHGTLNVFSPTSDFEYDGGNDKLFVFRNTNADGKTAFLGGNVGIGTANPTERLEVAGNLKVSGLINGHDLDAELQALAQGGASNFVVIQGDVADGGMIGPGLITGRASESWFVSLKKITLPAPVPFAPYDIECSFAPPFGPIPPGFQKHGEVRVTCTRRAWGATNAETQRGTASYIVIGYD